MTTFFESATPVLNIDFKQSLNSEQYAAVTAPDGPALVLAGAGSGKTRVLTYRVAWLLSQGVHPSEILLITFTNKAANEMLERVENLTKTPKNYFWGGTFHHIGQRILRKHGDVVGLSNRFNVIDESDAESLLSEVIRKADSSFLKSKNTPKPKLVNHIFSFARNTLQPISEAIAQKFYEWDFLSEQLTDFFNKYQKAKLEQQVTDYDDLLDYWLKLLKNHPEIASIYQNRFKHVLVDEYQDTNPLQAGITDLIAANHQIMAVGDEAQCIYTWRGADFKNILSFPQRHPNTAIYKIETNYRSTPNILNLANDVLSQQPTSQSFKKVLKPHRPHKVTPYWVSVSDLQQQAQFITRRIHGLKQEGYKLSDIAILYRAHYQAMDLQMELTKQKIPYQITSGIRFFEQAHIKDLVAQIRFVSNPQDTTAYTRVACLMPKLGPRTAQKLLELGQKIANQNQIDLFQAFEDDSLVAKVPEVARDNWIDFTYTLQNLKESISQESPQEVINVAIEGWYGDFLKTLHANWQSRLEDLESLANFAERFENLEELLIQVTLLSSEASQQQLESTEERLHLTTIHQAKGLEYPVVFLISLSESLFPLGKAVSEGNVDEELRLFYVGATRAMDELYLTAPKIVMQKNNPTLVQPSRFLKKLKPSSYEMLHFKGGF